MLSWLSPFLLRHFTKTRVTKEVVGSDERTDVALLKLKNATDLVPLPIGDSDKAAIGQWVMAIGNPFGLSHTTTSGIISARSRGQVGIVDYEDFIQTDAAINPGNSGGPLINTRGEAIGINTAIFTKTGGSVGIGFTIPINLAMRVVEQLKADGKVSRGQLGVVIQELKPDLAESFGLSSSQQGILVSQVVENSPAEKAGIQVGDIIMARDGEAVSSVAPFRNRIALTVPGTKTILTIWRDGEQQDMQVRIGEAEGAEVSASVKNEDGEQVRLGIRLQALTNDMQRSLGMENQQGVLVAGVEYDSPAARAGITVGNVLQRVNGKSVSNVDDALQAIRVGIAEGKPLRLLVWDKGGTRFVVVKLPYS